jgi:hypothetical protein
MEFPTNFTTAQLERLRELASKESSRVGNGPGRIVNPEIHHLAYKLDDYARNARSAENRRA